jgi:ATP-dependent Clp protease ATP-binding subunit ClpA
MLAIKKIVIKFTDDLKKSLRDTHNITLNLTESTVEHLAETGYDSKMGARPLSRKIDQLIRIPLSKKILFEKIKNANITVGFDGSEVNFDVTPKLNAEVDNNGYINLIAET